eukprot:14290.XXX_997790_997984_1 [CDS] Oithona nana genome sequencing.
MFGSFQFGSMAPQCLRSGLGKKLHNCFKCSKSGLSCFSSSQIAFIFCFSSSLLVFFMFGFLFGHF